jgi:hypothetical protein
MSIYITALCVMTPCSLVGSTQNCRGIYHFRIWNRVLCLENEVSKSLRKVGMYLTTWNYIPKDPRMKHMPQIVSSVMGIPGHRNGIP